LGMKALLTALGICVGVLLVVESAPGEERFPPPDFESTYQMPTMTQPPPKQAWQEAVDVGVLLGALSLASYFVIWRRNRTAVSWLSIFSLGYFGFYRRGCICPVGSLQNVTLSLFDGSYVLPVTVALFFALPLVFALLFGRVFCSSVCPLGAIQDVVLIKPVKVPRWLGRPLTVVPYLYLGAAVLFAATGTLFIICRYDPFVGFFRLSGPFHMLLIGGVVLLVAVFVGRPYCRFLCPYKVLLSWCSRFAWRRATITPDECIECSMCDGACPFDAILGPTPEAIRDEDATVFEEGG